jgi:hypothetical protein
LPAGKNPEDEVSTRRQSLFLVSISDIRSNSGNIGDTMKILLILLATLLLLSAPVSAQYLKVIVQPTPTNSPIETYVYQGDQIYMNRMYDLSGVSGTNLSFAHWNDWKEEDDTCNPDQVVDINYITNNQTMKVRSVPVTNPPFVLGNWYQWDGCHDLYSSNGRISGFGLDPNNNRLAFTIIPLPPAAIVPTATAAINISATPTPAPQPVITLIIKSTPTPIKQATSNGIPWWAIVILIAIIVFFMWAIW